MKFPIAEYRIITRRVTFCKPVSVPTELVSRGLGDTVYKLTHATGIAQTVQQLKRNTGWSCWCPRIQAWLNSRFSYR